MGLADKRIAILREFTQPKAPAVSLTHDQFIQIRQLFDESMRNTSAFEYRGLRKDVWIHPRLPFVMLTRPRSAMPSFLPVIQQIRKIYIFMANTRAWSLTMRETEVPRSSYECREFTGDVDLAISDLMQAMLMA